MVRLAVVIRALRKLPIEALDSRLRFVDMRKGQLRLLAHGTFILELHLLRQVADRRVSRHADDAACRLLQSGEDLEQRRFARAIFSDQRDPVFFVHHEREVVQQCESAKFDGQTFD